MARGLTTSTKRNAMGSKTPTAKKPKTGGRDPGESRARQSTADVVVEINKLWEKLRSKSTSSDDASKLSESVFELVSGRVKEMSLKHDASRAIQAVFVRGTEQHRTTMLAELKGQLRDLCMSKYGRQVILKMLNVGTKPTIAPIFSELQSFTRKLITHKIARSVVDCMFGEVGGKQHRALMMLDCLGREFALLVGESKASTSLSEMLDLFPERKVKVLARLHELLITLAQKQCLHSQLALHLLCEFVVLAEHGARLDVLGVAAPLCEQIVETGGTRESELAIVHMLSYGGAKERKGVMKGLKGMWMEMAMRDHGHRAVMTALDVVDDTTMLRKTVVADLLEPGCLDQLCAQKQGRRVLLHVLAPRDPHFFDQWTIQLMQPTFVPAPAPEGSAESESRMVPTSKKEPALRRAEILTDLGPALVVWCTEHPGAALTSLADVLLGLLGALGESSASSSVPAEHLDSLLDTLAHAAVTPSPETAARKPKSDNVDGAEEGPFSSTAVDHFIGRKTIRRLLDHSDTGMRFGTELLAAMEAKSSDGQTPALVAVALLRGGRFVAEALLKCEHTAKASAAILGTSAARAKLSNADNGVGQLLNPLLDRATESKSKRTKANATTTADVPTTLKRKASSKKAVPTRRSTRNRK